MVSNAHRDSPSASAEVLLEARVFVELMRSADFLARTAEAVLKPTGLSPTQYNVLRVLRGAGTAGLSCGEVGCRLITRDPDITRLLDRMESRGLISRTRADTDRRVVRTSITPEGLRILATLDAPVEQLHRRQFRHLSKKTLKTLLKLLEMTRASDGAGSCP